MRDIALSPVTVEQPQWLSVDFLTEHEVGQRPPSGRILPSVSSSYRLIRQGLGYGEQSDPGCDELTSKLLQKIHCVRHRAYGGIYSCSVSI